MEETERKARVLIVDDHPAMREALATRIGNQPDLEVAGEAASMIEALDFLGRSVADLAVIDITLKGGSGLELIKRIKERYPSVRMLVCSMHGETLYAERAIRAGALGYINKDQATEKIIEGIRRVREGDLFLSEETVKRLLQRTMGGAPGALEPTPEGLLADRELEVYRLIGKGLKTAQIAEDLHLSVKTVETYRSRIREKLKLGSATELAFRATQWVIEKGGV